MENIENKLVPIIFFSLILLVWQFTVDNGIVDRFTLPSPTDILITFVEILPNIMNHIMITLQEAFLGFTIAVGLAIVLSILMDNVPLIKKAIYPIVIVSQTVPLIALAPLFAMWFGFGKLPKVIVVILVCFFPVLVSLLHGLESVDKDLLNLLKSMGASKLHIFRLVKFPASLVSFFSGLRIAATYSIMGAIIGEWMGGKAGLGIYMMRIKHSYAYDKFFAVILIIVVLSMIFFKFICIIQNLLMPWSKELKENE
ncbi:Hydroxymethylpyrimidine ABC transporter, transmembrane component [Caldisalinibacter kiritimatiensis]|uniref:Hydroxymethylpyrimidine ABC transporter, transmembrane component n=1 Tax=Caldisalinibacter kiritimatiensis TaxID=1304284 RepID=R1AU44_9FIRM|nr:Hydroxymethylpyrimidine ABC transporter, transmembrane component [Caldisalinibacter kiritimatiensis]